ncbi:MAG: hypothetical protein QOD07_195 [Frankiaceae bacterium]|nr:hypothetical protein [Frankiaceae bacterium]
MQTSAIRVEVIRFSLLVTLTVALLSVAIRLASHNDSHATLRPGALPPSGSSTPSSAPSSPSAPAATRPPSPAATPARPHTAGGSGSGGSAAGQPGQPVLPVTGDDAVKLIALSMVLIGGGALTVRASRR